MDRPPTGVEDVRVDRTAHADFSTSSRDSRQRRPLLAPCVFLSEEPASARTDVAAGLTGTGRVGVIGNLRQIVLIVKKKQDKLSE
jgi:hypothetical protein